MSMKTGTAMGGMELSPGRRRYQARRNRLNRNATARPTSLTKVTIATLCPQDGCFNPMPCDTHPETFTETFERILSARLDGIIDAQAAIAAKT